MPSLPNMIIPRTDNMRLIEGGIYRMGSDKFYAEEKPRRRVRVDNFWIDRAPVTNRDFAAFVADTGYRTQAENPPNSDDYPDIPSEFAVPGSAVFLKTSQPVSLDNPAQWWRFVPGADWCHPTGPESSLEGLADHPVVHVTHADACAFASWAGKSLPSEAEWEYAARGGLDDREYAWGDTLNPGNTVLANYWRGQFPFFNMRGDENYRTTAIGTYPSNGYDLFDMIGNVWEWTDDWYILPDRHPDLRLKRSCCAPRNPRGGTVRESIDRSRNALPIGRKVLKGGSHLCAENYCQRYRPAARHPQAIDSGTSHIGFRCVYRPVKG